MKREAMPYDDNVWYHVTDRSRLPEIAQKGLVGSRRGTDRTWGDMPVEDQAVYLWPNVNQAWAYAEPPKEPTWQMGYTPRVEPKEHHWQDPVILRVKGIDRSQLAPDHEHFANSYMGTYPEQREQGEYDEDAKDLYDRVVPYVDAYETQNQLNGDNDYWDQMEMNAHAVDLLRTLPPELREEVARHLANRNGDPVMHYGHIPPHHIDVGNLNTMDENGEYQDRFHEEHPEWARGPEDDDDEADWYDAHDRALDEWMAQQGNWVSPEETDDWHSWGYEDPTDDSNANTWTWNPIRTAALEQASDGRIILYRGISLSRNDAAALIRDPESIDAILYTTGNKHWTESNEIAHRIATPNGRDGLVIEGLVNPQDVVQQGTDEWEELVHNNGVFIPGTKLYEQEREVPVRAGAQIEVASIMFVHGEEMEEVYGPRMITAASDDFWADLGALGAEEGQHIWHYRKPFVIDFSRGTDDPNPPMWIGKNGEFHEACPMPRTPYQYRGEIWEHTSPPQIQRAGSPDDVYDDVARAHAERAYHQQQGVNERTSSDGDAWNVSQNDSWFGPSNDSLYENVAVPGDAPGMPRNMETGFMKPCWCDNEQTIPHEWSPLCGKQQRLATDYWNEHFQTPPPLQPDWEAVNNDNRDMVDYWMQVRNGYPEWDGRQGRYPYIATDNAVHIGPEGGSHMMIERTHPELGEEPSQSHSYGEILHIPSGEAYVNPYWGNDPNIEERVLDAYNAGERMPGTWRDHMESLKIEPKMPNLHQAAEQTVMLYHGTTNKGWEVAQQKGGIVARDYEEAAKEIAIHYGVDPQEVYDHPWNSFTRTRTKNDIFLTGSREAAEHYAQDRSEVTTDLLRTIFRMTQMEEDPNGDVIGDYPGYKHPGFMQFRQDYFDQQDLQPVVLTLQVPVSALPSVVQRMVAENYPIQDTTVAGPVPLEWVVKVEPLANDIDAHFKQWFSKQATDMIPNDQVKTPRQPGTPDSSWDEMGQWDTDTFLDHNIINEHLKTLQQGQQYRDYLERQRREKDAEWPSMGLHEASTKTAKIVDLPGEWKDHGPGAPGERTFVYVKPTDTLYLAPNNAYHQDIFDWLYQNQPEMYQELFHFQGVDDKGQPYDFVSNQRMDLSKLALGFLRHDYPDQAMVVEMYWAEGEDRLPDHIAFELEAHLGERVYQRDWKYPPTPEQYNSDSYWESQFDPYYEEPTVQWPTNAQEPIDHFGKTAENNWSPPDYGSAQWDDMFEAPDYGENKDYVDYRKFLYSPSLPGGIHDWTQDPEEYEEWGNESDFQPSHSTEAKRKGLFEGIDHERGGWVRDYSPGIVTVRPDHVAVQLHDLAKGHDLNAAKEAVKNFYSKMYPGEPIVWANRYTSPALERLAADNVPGQPVSDSGHWVWLDGKVGFGGNHADIAKGLANDLGYEPTTANYISNWIARGHVPQEHAIALGTMKNNYPYIYNSTRDRNHIWDAVMRAQEGSGTVS